MTSSPFLSNIAHLVDLEETLAEKKIAANATRLRHQFQTEPDLLSDLDLASILHVWKDVLGDKTHPDGRVTHGHQEVSDRLQENFTVLENCLQVDRKSGKELQSVVANLVSMGQEDSAPGYYFCSGTMYVCMSVSKESFPCPCLCAIVALDREGLNHDDQFT